MVKLIFNYKRSKCTKIIKLDLRGAIETVCCVVLCIASTAKNFLLLLQPNLAKLVSYRDVGAGEIAQ